MIVAVSSVALVIAFAAVPGAPAAAPRMAVLPAPIAPAVDDRAVVQAVHKAARVRGVPSADVRQLVQSAAQSGIRCDVQSPECAARVGAFGGLDFVLIATVEADRAAFVLVDCADGRVVRRSAARLGEALEVRQRGLAALVREALGDGAARGVLLVDSDSDSAILVDGLDRGTAPLRLEVEAGSHAVGHDQNAQVVEVAAADTVAVRLAGRQTGAASPGDDGSDGSGSDDVGALAWVGGGAVAVGLVVAAGAGAGAALVAPDASDRGEVSAAAYNDAVGAGRALLGVAVVGAAAVALGGVALALALGSAS